MFANALASIWFPPDAVQATPERAPRRAPVFVGDAVQPFAGETLLLTLLREAALRELDQSEE